MLAVVWSLVGLLAVALGLLASAFFTGLSRLDARLDAFGSDIRGEIRELGTDLRGEIRQVRDAVHDLDVRLTTAGG
jgi:hypothetical protein